MDDIEALTARLLAHRREIGLDDDRRWPFGVTKTEEQREALRVHEALREEKERACLAVWKACDKAVKVWARERVAEGARR